MQLFSIASLCTLGCIAGVLVANACTTTSQKKELSDAQNEKLQEYKLEISLGRTMAGYILQHYGAYPDEQLVGYVNAVGSYVASRSDAPDRVYMFEVINSDAVNAFSCPGGYIMLTSGALKLAQSEAELAMLLGHEIAHVERQHMFKTLVNKSREKEKEEKIAHDRLPPSVLMRQRPTASDSAMSANIARYFTSNSGLGFGVMSAVKSGINVALQTGLSKDMEYEADMRGVEYAIRSGYKTDAMINFLDRLNAKKASLDVATITKTHPAIADREKRINEYLQKNGQLHAPGAEGKERFLDMKKRLGSFPIATAGAPNAM